MHVPLSIHRSWLKSVHVSYTACSLPHVWSASAAVQQSVIHCLSLGKLAQSSCWARPVSTWSENDPICSAVPPRRQRFTRFVKAIELYKLFTFLLTYLLTYLHNVCARARTHARTHTHTYRLDHLTPCLVIQVIGIEIWKPTTMSFESDTASAK